MKMETFSNMSIVGWKLSSSVSRRNQSLREVSDEEITVDASSMSKYILPSKRVSGDEAREDIIRADQPHGSDQEKLQIISIDHMFDLDILTANVIAKTRKLSRSTYWRSSAQCKSSLAIQPTVAP